MTLTDAELDTLIVVCDATIHAYTKVTNDEVRNLRFFRGFAYREDAPDVVALYEKRDQMTKPVLSVRDKLAVELKRRTKKGKR